jgi:hypothetical protein
VKNDALASPWITAATARAVVVSLLAVLLGGCTAVRIAYNNIDTVVRFMAADYVDMDDNQRESFRARLTRIHRWHRGNELPAYAALLETARDRVAKGLHSADVDRAAETLRGFYRRFAVRAVTEAAPVLVTLTPEQIIDLERKLADSNAKYASEHHLDDTPKRHRKLARQMKKRFEDWMGNLSEAQETRIERFVLDHDALTVMRLEDRIRRQKAGVAMIRAERDSAALAPRLAPLFAQPEIGRSAAYRAAVARYEAELAGLVMDIERIATPEQRARAVDRLSAYAADFRALAAQIEPEKAP